MVWTYRRPSSVASSPVVVGLVIIIGLSIFDADETVDVAETEETELERDESAAIEAESAGLDESEEDDRVIVTSDPEPNRGHVAGRCRHDDRRRRNRRVTTEDDPGEGDGAEEASANARGRRRRRNPDRCRRNDGHRCGHAEGGEFPPGGETRSAERGGRSRDDRICGRADGGRG